MEQVAGSESLEAFFDLDERIWEMPVDEERKILTRVLAHTGHYLVSVSQDDDVVGLGIGIVDIHAGANQFFLHSVGISHESRDRGIGYAIMLHAKHWALERNMTQMRWVFDPLEVKNAYFYVNKVGARIVAYIPHFYGDVGIGINSNDETDRFEAVWDLVDSRPPAFSADGESRYVTVPEDIVTMRKTDNARAQQWRTDTRAVMQPLLDGGWTVRQVLDGCRYEFVRASFD